MDRISAEGWRRALTACGVNALTAARWSTLFERHVQPDRFSAGARELDDFVGQVLHETAFLRSLEEDLNYSAERLVAVWPRRFPTLAATAPYAWNPKALAEKTYGGRLGNLSAGDGWKYRGRGIPQVTGKDNYAGLAKLTGLPLLEHPELLADPDTALRCGVLWWEGHVPDSAIDSCERVTRAVQGGQEALAQRAALTAKAKAALAA